MLALAVKAMANEWMDDGAKGFFGKVPLTSIALQDWAKAAAT